MAGSRESGPRGPIYTRRWVLGAAALAVGSAIGAGIELSSQTQSPRRPVATASPSAPDRSPSPKATDTEPVGSSLLQVINGQVVKYDKRLKTHTTLGASGANVYSLLNIEGCGYPSPVTSSDQGTILQVIRNNDDNFARGWHFRNEGDPKASQQSLENVVRLAGELDIYLMLTLSGNDTDGCGESAKGPDWYAGGYKKEGYLNRLASIERSLQGVPGSERVIFELANEMGNGINLDPRVANEFLKAGAGSLKGINPNRLVAGSILLGNSLTQSGNFEQVLAGRPVDIMDLHFYSGGPQLPIEPVKTATAYKIPVLIGEMGVNPANIDQFGQLFDALKNKVFGVLSWGQKIVNPTNGQVLYQTTDGWGFDPGSSTARLFNQFAPIFEHPRPNAANAKLGIRR